MPTEDNDTPAPARLLRGAALAFVLLGVVIVTWLVDKAIRYPSVRAAQGAAKAPLWIPFILAVTAGTGVIAYLFVRAARRVEQGEDLFGRRHRRRPSGDFRGPRIED